MNKTSGTRKSFSALTTPMQLDLAASVDNIYYNYVDRDYLSSGMNSIIESSKTNVGELISKRDNTQYINELLNNRKDNYYGKWYESGWLKNFKSTGLRIRFGQTFYPSGTFPYSTAGRQGYCLDRDIIADFGVSGGYPYGKYDEYPNGITKGTKFKICGYVVDNDPFSPPFVSPYKNIYELQDHSGYQIGSMGRNYWSKNELINFGITSGFADFKISGLQSADTGIRIAHNKLYFQDNIPNLDWCIRNRCSFVYTNLLGAKNAYYDNPYAYRDRDQIKYRVFVFSGSINWLPTGTAPKTSTLAYGPYFQKNNTGLYRLYNDNFIISNSGVLNDNKNKYFSVINTGDAPRNFYVSVSDTGMLDINDFNYKTSNFYYPDNHPESGQLVKYYTVGKNNSIEINYNHYFSQTGSLSASLANGSKVYLKTGAIILSDVTGTKLVNGFLNFMTKDSYIRVNSYVVDNNTKMLFDDYYYAATKGNAISVLAKTGNSINYNLNGQLVLNSNGSLQDLNTSIFGLTVYSSGSNLAPQRAILRAKYDSGIKSIPDIYGESIIDLDEQEDSYITILNTDQQYLKYSIGYSGLFDVNGQVSNTKNGFNPLTGAVQLDLLFKIKNEKMPTFDTTNSNQEYYSLFSGTNTYKVETQLTGGFIYKNINTLYLKRGYTYNFLQCEKTNELPFAVKGDISQVKVTQPNFNQISGNYRLIQFKVNEDANDISWFSVKQNPISGYFNLTGQNLVSDQFKFVFRRTIPNPNFIPSGDRVARTGIKLAYTINNQLYPELFLERNNTYYLNTYTGFTGFYFYTGLTTYGSGLFPYSGNGVSTITTGDLNRHAINANLIPSNLYYGDRYNAHAGNKVNSIPQISTDNTKFTRYNIPVFTGNFSIRINDFNMRSNNISYSLMQDSGSIPIY